MPGLVTHYIFGHSVLNKLDEDDKNTINRNFEIFNIGTQGPDMFFYYIPGLLKQRTKQLGLIMHKKNIRDFFKEVIVEMNNLQGKDREIAFSYIAGYLTHYALDYNTHKYIYFKTGFRQKGNPLKSNKYSLLHKKLETNIDIMLYKALSEEHSGKSKAWEVLNADVNDAVIVTMVMSRAIERVYGRYVNTSDIKNSILYMKNITKVLGIKEDRIRIHRKLKDDLTIGEKEIEMIKEMQNKIGIDYFNLEHKKWYSPSDLVEQHTESFLDLYFKGEEICIKIIDALFNFYNKKITLDKMIEIVGNFSMATGLDCDKDKPFVHYDLIK